VVLESSLLARGLFDDSFQISDVELLRRFGDGISYGAVASFLHLKDVTAEVFNFLADLSQDGVPQLFPLHSDLHLCFDAF